MTKKNKDNKGDEDPEVDETTDEQPEPEKPQGAGTGPGGSAP